MSCMYPDGWCMDCPDKDKCSEAKQEVENEI